MVSPNVVHWSDKTGSKWVLSSRWWRFIYLPWIKNAIYNNTRSIRGRHQGIIRDERGEKRVFFDEPNIASTATNVFCWYLLRLITSKMYFCNETRYIDARKCYFVKNTAKMRIFYFQIIATWSVAMWLFWREDVPNHNLLIPVLSFFCSYLQRRSIMMASCCYQIEVNSCKEVRRPTNLVVLTSKQRDIFWQKKQFTIIRHHRALCREHKIIKYFAIVHKKWHCLVLNPYLIMLTLTSWTLSSHWENLVVVQNATSIGIFSLDTDERAAKLLSIRVLRLLRAWKKPVFTE